jgi:hypothetical protein
VDIHFFSFGYSIFVILLSVTIAHRQTTIDKSDRVVRLLLNKKEGTP